VLFVGGASGVGKTTLAYVLGQRFSVNVVAVDDIHTALETVTTPEQQPLIHFWRTNWPQFSAYSDQEHVEHFLDVSRQVYNPVLTAVVADRLAGGMPAIIEGDFILPELAARPTFNGQANDGRVQALFVQEHDEAQIAANVMDRQGGDASLPARTSWLKNQWLQRECDRLGIPTVAARPWATAADRAVMAITHPRQARPHAPGPGVG
jgi:2-phosphoglycerate kinase